MHKKIVYYICSNIKMKGGRTKKFYLGIEKYIASHIVYNWYDHICNNVILFYTKSGAEIYKENFIKYCYFNKNDVYIEEKITDV